MKTLALAVVSIALGGCAALPNDSTLWPYGKTGEQSGDRDPDQYFRTYEPPKVSTQSTPGYVVVVPNSGSEQEPEVKPVAAPKKAEAIPPVTTRRPGRLKPVEVVSPAPATKRSSVQEESPVSVDLRKDPK